MHLVRDLADRHSCVNSDLKRQYYFIFRRATLGWSKGSASPYIHVSTFLNVGMDFSVFLGGCSFVNTVVFHLVLIGVISIFGEVDSFSA